MTTVFGPDFSHWHPVTAGAPFKAAGMRFAYAKCSDTAMRGNVDGTWIANRNLLRSANIPVGGYHFYRHNVSPEANANAFIANYGDPKLCQMPPICDAEDPNVTVSKVVAADQLERFLALIDKAFGRTCGIYTGDWWWTPHVEPRASFGRRPLWLSAYTQNPPKAPKPWGDWSMWQFTDRAPVVGAVSGPFDMSQTTDAKLAALLGTSVVIGPPPKTGLTHTLVPGDKDKPMVLVLQVLLTAFAQKFRNPSVLPGKIDGIFGHQTELAVISFKNAINELEKAFKQPATFKSLDPGVGPITLQQLQWWVNT